MSFFLFNALLQAAKHGTKYYNDTEKWKNENLSICRDCKTENPKGANFCGNCRSNNLTGRKQAAKEAVVEKRIQQEEALKVIQVNRRLKLAKDYYNEYSKYRICNKCSIIQEQSHHYCMKCGSDNIVVPTYILLEWMKTEFPDIIQNYDDVIKVKEFDNPYEITFGKVAVSTAEVAGKMAFKAGKAAGSSIFKELSRRYFKK